MVENIKKQVDEYYKMKKKTILAVDDSGVILRTIKTLLEDKYQVIPVNSSEMAIKYLALNIPVLSYYPHSASAHPPVFHRIGAVRDAHGGRAVADQHDRFVPAFFGQAL